MREEIKQSMAKWSRLQAADAGQAERTAGSRRTGRGRQPGADGAPDAFAEQGSALFVHGGGSSAVAA
ncbi:hypothetical protein GCM10020220_042150 [Nonomuraea rubra]